MIKTFSGIFRLAGAGVFLLAVLALGLSAPPAQAGFVDQFAVVDDIGRNKIPRLGKSRILAIPVVIENLRTPDLKRWEKFFGPGPGPTFAGYYAAASLGRYTPEVVLAKPVTWPTCPLPPSWKGCAIPRGDITALGVGVKFLHEVLNRALTEQNLDLRQFDTNGPGGAPDDWADGILILPNGDFPGVALPISNPTLMKYAQMISPGMKVPSAVFEQNGVKVGAVGIASIFDGPVVTLHEFGHLLGFGDLYHEKKYGRGLYFSLMGQYDPGLPFPDPMSRLKAGWGEVTDITQPGVHRLKPAETHGEMLRIGTGKDYLLLENRGPGKVYSTQPKQRGLAVFRIDENKYPANSELAFIQQIQKCLNCETWRPLTLNVPNDPSFPVQSGQLFQKKGLASLLFFPGDTLGPDPSGQPLSDTHLVPSTNFASGAPSGLSLKVLPFEGDTLVLEVKKD